MSLVPPTSIRARRAVVATADQLATQAAMAIVDRGGNAVDAAIAANAAMAVVAPHLCGLGGDLFALVRTPEGDVVALNASGRAGAGASAEAVRADGHREMPLRHDIRTVTVPGCVDGWSALHERFGRLDLATILTPAIRAAADGFAASPLLIGSLNGLDDRGRTALSELAEQATRTGAAVRRPGVALTLQAIAAGGRDAFYRGAFGEGLLELGGGWFAESDLEAPLADWVAPLGAAVWGVDLWTMPPNSQGYLTLGASRLTEVVGVVDDPDDPAWAHVLIEAATAAGHDRLSVLHERADGDALVDTIDGRVAMVDRDRASRRGAPAGAGDTTYLCTADASGLAVSLIQSNASGFGSWIVEPTSGINLHNRGLGFSLQPGHPAELAAGRRPPHTLSPALATRNGELVAVFGSMGGDAQPQILQQLATRLFRHGQSPAQALAAGRWALRGPATGFDTWAGDDGPSVVVEGNAAPAWASGLAALGHRVDTAPPFDSEFGHAHVIVVEPTGSFAAAADPRTRVGSAAGL